jgi:hypothetical protein
MIYIRLFFPTHYIQLFVILFYQYFLYIICAVQSCRFDLGGFADIFWSFSFQEGKE